MHKLNTWFAGIIFCTAFHFAATAAASDVQTPTLSVSANGTASAKPDVAIVSVGVVEEAETARDALDANNRAMADVLQAMRDAGIEERDLQTSGFSIQPRYTYPKRKANGEQPPPVVTGYVVNNNLTIRIRQLEKTGEILDQTVSLGVNTGGSIRFTNSNETALLEVARENAVRDAIRKAKTLTAAAGVGLGKITAINESSRSLRPVGVAQARALAVQEDAGSVPIASGENEYNVTVQISWEIEQ